MALLIELCCLAGVSSEHNHDYFRTDRENTHDVDQKNTAQAKPRSTRVITTPEIRPSDTFLVDQKNEASPAAGGRAGGGGIANTKGSGKKGKWTKDKGKGKEKGKGKGKDSKGSAQGKINDSKGQGRGKNK